MKDKNSKFENPSMEMDELRKQLLEDHKNKITEIERKITEAESMAANAEHRMTSAKDQDDFEAYDQAVNDRKHAAFNCEVSKTKLKKEKAASIVSDSESDRLVRKAINYKQRLDKQTLKEIANDLNHINKLLSEYEVENDKVTRSLNLWTDQVHLADDQLPGVLDGKYRRSNIPFAVRETREVINDLLSRSHELRDALTEIAND